MRGRRCAMEYTVQLLGVAVPGVCARSGGRKPPQLGGRRRGGLSRGIAGRRMEGCGWCVMIRSAAVAGGILARTGPEAAQPSTKWQGQWQRPSAGGWLRKGGGLAAWNQAACDLRTHPTGPWLFLPACPRQGGRHTTTSEPGLNFKVASPARSSPSIQSHRKAQTCRICKQDPRTEPGG